MAGYNVNIAVHHVSNQEADLLSEDVNTMALNSPTSYLRSEDRYNFDVSLDQNASSIHMQEEGVPLSPIGQHNRETPKSPKSPRIHVKIFLWDKFQNDRWPPREGADTDVLEIKSIIHFEDYESNFEPVPYNRTRAELKEFLQQDLCKGISHGDALCLFFSSHGKSQGFICYDGRLMKFDTVISILKKSVWSNFPSIYALVFFICCREGDKKPSLEINDISVKGKLVVVFSVEHGHGSFREDEGGTYFIQNLKSCIRKTLVKKINKNDDPPYLTTVFNMLLSECQRCEIFGMLKKELKISLKPQTSSDQPNAHDESFDSDQFPSLPFSEPFSSESSDDTEQKEPHALFENTSLRIKKNLLEGNNALF